MLAQSKICSQPLLAQVKLGTSRTENNTVRANSTLRLYRYYVPVLLYVVLKISTIMYIVVGPSLACLEFE